MNQIPTAHDSSDARERVDAVSEAKASGEHPADEVSALARHGDPSRQKSAATPTSAIRRPSGIAWVRPSELVAGAGGRVVGRGIDLHAELYRRTRALPVHAAAASRRAIRERALRLPPVSSFGRHPFSQPAPTRSGAGLR